MTIKSIHIVDCYDRETNNYLGSFEQTDENILNYVAGLSLFDAVYLIERISDQLLLTTIGNFLDQVSDQQWLNRVFPRLIAKQTGNCTIVPVKMIQ